MKGWIAMLAGVLTLAAMAVAGWQLYSLAVTGNLGQDETRLVIRFSDAHGVPVGGSVRHKGVRVGEVLGVAVAPDDSGVILEVTVAPQFGHTLRTSSRFWIVRPLFVGLAEGVSGLDTLIKDPYVEFDTPDPTAPLLAAGSVVFGRNQAPVAGDDRFYAGEAGLQPPLQLKIRIGMARGLGEGAPVLYRDVPVGTVLGVDLSLDGRAVEVEAEIHGRYRETVRSNSVFWVARPSVEVGFDWPSVVNVSDLSKIITGVALAYATPAEPPGKPVPDGAVLIGQERPPADLEEMRGPLVTIEPLGAEAWREEAIDPAVKPVGVSFGFTEKDLLRDRRYFFEGTGVLFPGSGGETLVLTARTLADGTYSSSDTLGDPDIEDADLKVRFPGGGAVPAQVVWVDPAGRDLAVLALPPDACPPVEQAPPFSPDGRTEEYYVLLAFREDDQRPFRSQPIPQEQVPGASGSVLTFDPRLGLQIDEWLGALLVDRTGRIAGVVGRREALADEAAVALLAAPPELGGAASPEAAGGEAGK